MEIENTVEKKNEIEKKEKSIMDTLSERITELRNSEKEFMNRVTSMSQMLEQAKADLIAVRARIDEIQKLIDEQTKSDPEKS